ncbi:MAG TPA: hypothetical protein VHB23_15485 [Devosiaceae bacterium]|nr:hypothetical protein [Devosiaceae bacterium]
MTQPQAALLAALLLAILALFHLALALGAPFGALAWGGQAEGQLSQRLRTGSALLSALIIGMAVVVLIRGGWIWADDARSMTIPVWCVVLFLVLQLGGALRSASSRERLVMTPLYIVAAAAAAYASYSPTLAG